MTQMPEAIATALVAFQANNSAMTLDKKGNRSQYASVGSMMTLVKKAAKEHGIGISFPSKRIDGQFCKFTGIFGLKNNILRINFPDRINCIACKTRRNAEFFIRCGNGLYDVFL